MSDLMRKVSKQLCHTGMSDLIRKVSKQLCHWHVSSHKKKLVSNCATGMSAKGETMKYFTKKSENSALKIKDCSHLFS